MIIGTVRPEEARVFDQDAGYHHFKADDGSDYGSFEVFWCDGQAWDCEREDDEPVEDMPEFYHATWVEAAPRPGWYWWSCFPGCMPDGEPNGPFASSSLAKSDALDE